ncbi:hypothetical protein D3C87_2176200 [compost metagenome]
MALIGGIISLFLHLFPEKRINRLILLAQAIGNLLSGKLESIIMNLLFLMEISAPRDSLCERELSKVRAADSS